MLRLVVFYLIFTCFSIKCLSQKEAHTWYFGINAGLNFNTIPASVITDGKTNTREGVSTISDKNTGKVLFYSDGTKIWDRTHAIMPNGNGLLGDYSSTQSSIAIPNPADANKYFLFTTALWEGFRYSEVDITLNSGRGDLIPATKNKLLLSTAASSEKLIATRHCNGKDFWVVTHTLNSNSFFIYLINQSGIQAPVKIDIGHVAGGAENWEGTSYLKFSSDGSRLVNVIGNPAVGVSGRVEVFNFNNKSGVVSGPVIQLRDFNQPYGAEFSSDNRLLYISSNLDKALFQYDLNAPDVNASRIVVDNSELNFGALQMGPDGIIYVAAEDGYNRGFNYLGVITQPQTRGVACNYIEKGIALNGKQTLIGLPTFNASYLKKDTSLIKESGLCFGSNTKFSLSTANNIDSLKWNFGDTSPESNLANPGHLYAGTGAYNASVIIYRSCNANDTIRKTINIRGGSSNTVNATVCDRGAYTLPDGKTVSTPGDYSVAYVTSTGCDSVITTRLTINKPPDLNLGNDTSICNTANVVLRAGSGFSRYLWQDGSTSASYTVSLPGIYWAEVQSAQGCKTRDSIVIGVAGGPAFSLGKDTTICDNANLVLAAGNGFASYLWHDGSTQQSKTVSAAGVYWAEVQSQNGCRKRDSIRIFNNVVSGFTLGPDTALCKNSMVVLGKNLDGASYAWNTGATSSQIEASSSGEYWVQISRDGCIKNDTMAINEKPSPVVVAQSSNDIDCNAPFSQLDVTGAHKYVWTPSTGLDDASSNKPIAKAPTTTTYIVKGVDRNGCSSYDSVTVSVLTINGIGRYDVPNAFSPNGDGKNDCFGLQKWGLLDQLALSIYNRFGQRIFHSNNTSACWDGTFKGMMQDPGGFVYIIKAKSSCGDVTRKGIVMLIR